MVRRPKQLVVPGTELKKIKEVDDAAEGYVDVRDRRMKLTKKEVEAKNALIAVMEKHKLLVYRDDSASPPMLVTLVPGKAGVKVSVDGAGDPGEEVGGEE